MHFWNQFENNIDKAETVPVSKFSYLRELLISRVRLLIGGLPFTFEDYSKSILLGKFSKSTEIAVTHIQFTTSLPVIQNSHPNRIHDFYENSVIRVQTLYTMSMLKRINRYVRLTLDKLLGIRTIQL